MMPAIAIAVVSGTCRILDRASDAAAPVTVRRMRAVIQPAPLEYGIYRDAYDDFVRALAEEDIQARIEAPFEERGALQHAATEIVIYLAEHAGDALIAVIMTKVFETLGRAKFSKKPRPPRHGVIFGPKGEVLR